jgi:hypothetical protein
MGNASSSTDRTTKDFAKLYAAMIVISAVDD